MKISILQSFFSFALFFSCEIYCFNHFDSQESYPFNIVDATQCYTAGRINEIFSPCGNNACQNTCRNPTATTGCTGGCVAGCICSPGYIRNSQNICVLPGACDVQPVCPKVNQVFSFTANTGCERSCSNLLQFGCIPGSGTPGCVCVLGYVKDGFGNCILPTACPLTCPGVDEHYSICGNNGCQRSCTRPDVRTCIPSCGTPACICNSGYMRDSRGVCILPHQCPNPICLQAHEVASPCGNNGCQPACNRVNPMLDMCIPMCSSPGCICASGYKRSTLGTCVLMCP